MALTKQARVLTEEQVQKALVSVSQTTHAIRDTTRILLSVRAGLRAKEIACLEWGMVCGADGEVCTEIRLENRVSKGRSGGRVIPIHAHLYNALVKLYDLRTAANKERSLSTDHVIYSTKGNGVTAESCANWFGVLYKGLGLEGCSSHSGRRTFITACARKIGEHGGSLRDVQMLAGHASLTTTERYIAADSAAQRAVVGAL